jgi:hypothetical protein
MQQCRASRHRKPPSLTRDKGREEPDDQRPDLRQHAAKLRRRALLRLRRLRRRLGSQPFGRWHCLGSCRSGARLLVLLRSRPSFPRPPLLCRGRRLWPWP